MAENIYKLGAVSLNGTLLKGITGQSLDPRIERFVNRAGGAPYPSFIAGRSTLPLLSGTTTDVATFLGLTGFGPLAITTTATLYLAKTASGSGLDSGSTHIALAINEGMIIPRRLTAGQGREATIQFDVIGVYDGTNDPITYAANQSLPSGYDNIGEKFTLGPAVLSTTPSITALATQEIDLDFGIREYVNSRDGEPYARYVCMDSMDPSVRIRTLDATKVSTVTFAGKKVGAILYFSKINEGLNSRVAAATEEHISITFADGMATVGPINGSPEASIDVVYTPSYNGTNAIGVIDTTAAIVTS